MPEKADISRTLLLPFMSIILLVAVYMTANVLLPLKASGKGSKESEDVQESVVLELTIQPPQRTKFEQSLR
jgi:N-acetylmuramoyl-L-alanine amidase